MTLLVKSIIVLLLMACGNTSLQKEKSIAAIPIPDNCDKPDADINCCFVNMPAGINHIINIAPVNEPGERLTITGTVFHADGVTPYADVIIYAYHTNNKGHYLKKGNETGIQKWHGHLHGWCKTGSSGAYEIHTIRPARYPENTITAHIHAAVKAPGIAEPFYINDFVFKDDSLVNEKYISRLHFKGGTGVVDVNKNNQNVWTGTRNIVL